MKQVLDKTQQIRPWNFASSPPEQRSQLSRPVHGRGILAPSQTAGSPSRLSSNHIAKLLSVLIILILGIIFFPHGNRLVAIHTNGNSSVLR